MSRHHESPIRRVNPSGKVVWVARYTGPDGRRRSAGQFKLRRKAQDAIDNAYARPVTGDTVGAYAETWTRRHPRAERTNATNDHRVSRVLDVPVDGVPLLHWQLRDLRRRHALELVDHMLRRQGRATTGAVNILRALSAMAEDAITDELCGVNPFKGVTVRANDVRARKARREVRVLDFDQMHTFAAAAGRWEPLVRCFADTGLRLGEVLPLRRRDFDGESLTVVRTAHEGRVFDGTKTDHGELTAGRVVPCPPGLATLIRQAPSRLDTDLLFPTPTGRMWRERNFYRDVWALARKALKVDWRPHEFRHSYVTHLRAAGVDDADLAAMAGHRVDTMLARYTHSLGRSHSRVREVIG